MSRIELVLPRMGESVEEGTITFWHVEEGQSVRAGDVLVEVSTDKVETEIEAPTDCTVEGIAAPAGTTVEVGARLAWLVTDDDVTDGPKPEPKPEPAPAATAGAPVEPAEPVGPPAAAARAAEIPRATSVAPVTAPAPNAGARPVGRLAPLSPVVRRLLAEFELRPADVAGTGRGGRITRSDVLSAAASPRRAPVGAAPAAAVARAPIAPETHAHGAATGGGPVDLFHITVDLGGLADPVGRAPSRRACLAFALARALERHAGALGMTIQSIRSIAVDGRRLADGLDLRLPAIDDALERASESVGETVALWDLVDSPLSGASYAPASPTAVAVLTVQPPRPEILNDSSRKQVMFEVRSVSTVTLAVRAGASDPVAARDLLVTFASLVEQTDWSAEAGRS